MFEVVGSVVAFHLLIKPSSYIISDGLSGCEASSHRASVKQAHL
jgi:hypothetical protein